MVENWIPYKLEIVEQKVQVLWLDLQDRFVEEPFFDETIYNNRIAMSQRSVLVSVSDLQVLCDWASGIDRLEPSAFIFHVSRCGSTLLSQCLVADRKNIVIAEAPLLEEVLHIDEALLISQGISREYLFKAVLTLLGQRRQGQRQLFIKLDSWHLHSYDLLRQWFPTTPFYFISREPKAIVRSHQRRRGIQMIPGYLSDRTTPLKVQDKHYQDFSLFTADVLIGFYNQLSDIKSLNNPLDGFFDYKDTVEKMIVHFHKHCGIQPISLDILLKRTLNHSKYPEQVFRNEEEEWIDFPYQACLDSYLKFSQLSQCH